MREIIFNEIAQIEKMINIKIVDEGISIKRFLLLLVKYYFEELKDFSVKKYKEKIQEIVHEFSMPIEYEDYKYDSYIERLCRNIKSGKIDNRLKNIDKIDVTKPEMDVVRQGNTDREKKLLFTMFVLAKSVLNPSGWVNYRDNIVMKYGNLMGCTKYQFHIMIHDLCQAGLMDFNHKIGVHGYKIELLDGETELSVTNFKNIGNQCLAYLKPDWKMCECCGRMIKPTNNRQKYCKKCAEKVRAEQKRKSNNLQKNT